MIINIENYEWLDKEGLAYFFSKLKVYMSSKYLPVLFDTTEHWNNQTSLISEKNTLYVYTDYMTNENLTIPGFKLGDGKAYLIDLPFTDKVYYDHIRDQVIHITEEERILWNNKVSCELSNVNKENLIFYK